MGDILYEIFICICLVAVIKSLLVGSDFSFCAWAKYGKEYTEWYFNRETWDQYLDRKFEGKRR